MNYEMIIKGKYDVRELNEELTVEESLDEVSMRVQGSFLNQPDFPKLEGGEDFSVFGKAFGTSTVKQLFSGVIWDINENKRGSKKISLTCYDRSIYMARSEDEYLFSKGQTAAQRIKKYAADWGIPLGSIANTGVALAKSVYRAQPIQRMIESDLNETSDKGGFLYVPRMNVNKLELVPIGNNKEVWILESTEEIDRNRSLDNAVTQVKVLGKEEEGKRTPVLATVSKDTKKYGTIQKVLQDDKVKKKSDAEKAGKKLLTGIEERIVVRALDINTIRAGDAVKLNNKDWFVISVKRNLGSSGMMTLELGSLDLIRRRYYGGSV
ncbi:phage portal protein [Virgibacillus halodenitrificans]|uniref:XkdQ/YqbQ family protein n=1 Tax=Virgibacillus halodenitrificans TaxID=1482 RepID=UPI001370B69D|nr:phage portal protein [Virgibacillus halodenitrificans]MYL45060.1 phage portal protein [Virgibacillus halodenitrificans]